MSDLATFSMIFNGEQDSYKPYNAATKKLYSGMNVTRLEAAARELGTTDPRWCTFLQAKELGGKVRKGQHGTKIELWKIGDYEKENDEGEKETKRGVLKRTFVVFNASQIDGIPELSK